MVIEKEVFVLEVKKVDFEVRIDKEEVVLDVFVVSL